MTNSPLEQHLEQVKAWLAEGANTQQIADKLGAGVSSVRRLLRAHDIEYRKEIWQPAPASEAGVNEVELRRLLKTPRTLIELADHFDCSPAKVQWAIDALGDSHVLVEAHGDTLGIGSAIMQQPARVIDSHQFREIEIPIGFISDTHFCSNYARLDVAEDLYDRFAMAGVTDVYHAGNWIDGEGRGGFNKSDIHVHGMANQVQFFVDNYPRREGITTHLISGDDHEGWYVQREGINIGQLLEDTAHRAGRTDLVDLGYMERDVEFAQEGGSSRLRVIHAGGGSSYAVSYTSQKYVESLQGGEKPQIVLVGHFHKFDYCYPREVHVVQAMCTQDQTPFMRKKRLLAAVGGGILWVTQNELGIFTSVKVQTFPYFDRKFYQYHWTPPASAR